MMVGIRHELASIVTVLLVCAGAIAANTEARPSAGIVTGDDAEKPQDPVVLRFDGGFKRASTLFRLGRFAEAERQFAWIADVRKGTTWGELSQYYLAECQYQQKKYVAAHVSYEKLYADYPSTGYKDKLVEREYEIAQIWLAQADPGTPAEKKLPWTARFDGRLPLLDCGGSALKALEHVRNNYPDGPLADDAAIQIADYYMKRHHYDSAALYYDHFVAEYCRSRFWSHARLAAIEARIRGYLDSVVRPRSS